MTDLPQHPFQVLDALQAELAEIDQELESGGSGPDASEDQLRVASLLAKQGRFSNVSGEVVDDLLADEDAIPRDLRTRLTGLLERALDERRLQEGALEPLLIHRRVTMSLDLGALAEALRGNLADDVAPPSPEQLRAAEDGTLRFDDLADGDAGCEIVAAWIGALEVDPTTAVAALERSLPELAGAGFGGGGDSARRTSSRRFLQGVADRLGVEYPGRS